MSKKVELLAPAGNVQAFIGAVNAGADAVYLGGAKFGARAYADNFTTQDLISCIRYAHFFGRRVYLTVNTLIKEDEMSELYDYLAPFYEAGLDAVIVQDFGVFSYIKRNFPDMEMHVSTQMTVTGAEGAAFLKELGADRIVPARELSLKEIIHMKEETGLDIETFIHGAMCYCYSGQCLFSSILGGRSGNRGRCAQPCRLPYSVDINGKHMSECYPLSLKDMCTIEHIGEFMEAGIDSFKIEGRMKKPEYAAGVTSIYRKYIDQKLKHPDKSISVSKKDMDLLTGLYIRSQRQDGYYYKQNGADMVTLDSPAYSGSDDNVLAQIREKYVETRLTRPVSMYASFLCGEEVSLTCISDNFSVTVTGNVMEQAKNQPLTGKSIEKQLKKLGDTSFEAEYIEVNTDNQGFYSLKAINELRREAIGKLEDMIIESYGLAASRDLEAGKDSESVCDQHNEAEVGHRPQSGNIQRTQAGFSILISTPEQWNAVSGYLKSNDLPVSHIYVESDLISDTAFVKQLSDRVKQEDFPEIYVALPYIMRQKDEMTIGRLLTDIVEQKAVSGVLIRNLEENAYIRKHGYDKHLKLISDAGIYMWNEEAYAFWQGKFETVTCPLELNQREWLTLYKDRPVEKMIYGRIPMMVTANCISKTGGKCLKAGKTSVAYLTDRYKKKLPVMIQCKYCLNIILNSVPLSLHNKESLKWYDKVTKRIAFTTENTQETKETLQFFANIFNDIQANPPYPEYTTGHEKRGVE